MESSLLIFIVGILAVIICLFVFRQSLGIFIVSSLAPVPKLAALNERESGEWIDNYYTVEKIDDDTYAIGEPRYHQENFHYLFVGADRALLFDSGAGLKHIDAVVSKITELPVTVLPSHFHYDHVGGCDRFARVAIADLPVVRARAAGNVVTPKVSQHLGKAEKLALVSLNVTEWVTPGDVIDLGGRQLEVIHTPGHTEEHIVLWDSKNQYLFTSDFLYDGPLLSFLPGGSLKDYLITSQTLLKKISKDSRIFGAHRSSSNGIPELEYQDLQDLVNCLLEMKEGARKWTGLYPAKFQVNNRITMLTDIPWLERW